MQQPYEWGYQGMKLMADYLEGDKSGIPADGLIIVPGRSSTQSNVDAFEAELKARQRKLATLGGGAQRAAGPSIAARAICRPHLRSPPA